MLSPPVFNCVFEVARQGESVVACCVNLAGIEGRGATEREALAAAVGQLKAALARYHQAKVPIPWLPVADQPTAGTTRRLVPVHL